MKGNKKNVGFKPNLQVTGLQVKNLDSFDFYNKQYEKITIDYIENTTSNTFASEKYLNKLIDSFSRIFNKNFLTSMNATCSALSETFPFLKESSFNVRNCLISYITLSSNDIDNKIKFLQEIQEDTLRLANKTFKFQFLACYIHLYLLLNDYNNAYRYCLQAAKYINSAVELYYYSALNLIFEKQNKTECLKNIQEIIKILKNNQKSKLVNYMNIANYNGQIQIMTNEIKFNKLTIYFLKEALKKSIDKERKGELLSYILAFYYEEEKYYMAIGYGKIALKYLENKETISETLDYIASSYYFISKYKKAIENYHKLIQFENVDKAKIYMQIADCQHELGEIETMKENVKKAYSIGSNDKKVQKTINEVYTDIERGKYDNSNNN